MRLITKRYLAATTRAQLAVLFIPIKFLEHLVQQ